MAVDLCSFGCGQASVKSFKNGKNCCSLSVNKCPAKRANDSLKKAGKAPAWKNGHPRGMLGKHSWSAGLTKENTPSLLAKGAQLHKRLASKELVRRVGFRHTEETKSKLSQFQKSIGAGGCREGSGRGKKGRYKGYWCDSSWELAWVVYNLEHNIPFKRNTEKFPYVTSGVAKNYVPDFVLLDSNTYVEIKGYFTQQVEDKISSFPNALLIIDKEGIVKYIEYAVGRYGKNYIDLYENE